MKPIVFYQPEEMPAHELEAARRHCLMAPHGVTVERLGDRFGAGVVIGRYRGWPYYGEPDSTRPYGRVGKYLYPYNQ